MEEKKEKIEKKIEKKEEGSKEEKQTSKTMSKQAITLFTVLGIILVLTICFFVFQQEITRFFAKEQDNNLTIVNYHGLQFIKTNISNITHYLLNIQVHSTGGVKTFSTYFRNSPYELLYIPYGIRSRLRKKSYISFTNETLQCEDGHLVAMTLGQFMGHMGSTPTGAVTDPGIDETSPVVDCLTHKDEPVTVVILIAGKDESRVYQHPENPDCMIIASEGCELIPAAETFMIGTLLNAMQTN